MYIYGMETNLTDELLRKLGMSGRGLARELGRESEGMVHRWRDRKLTLIPTWWHDRILKIAKDRGVKLRRTDLGVK